MSVKEFQLEFQSPAGEETVKVIATTEPLNLRELGLVNFKEGFQALSGEERTNFIKKVLNNLTTNRLDWSEDTVVVRSHE